MELFNNFNINIFFQFLELIYEIQNTLKRVCQENYNLNIEDLIIYLKTIINEIIIKYWIYLLFPNIIKT